MQTALVFFSLCFAMSRVVGVRDSRTIVADTNGVLSTVTLNNVAIAPDEETLAADYLRHMISNTWVLIDNGDVYRSPDALFINADMNRHPWRLMRYLGELDLGARPKGQPALKAPPPPVRATPKPRKKKRIAG